jgi:hypothetical protein
MVAEGELPAAGVPIGARFFGGNEGASRGDAEACKLASFSKRAKRRDASVVLPDFGGLIIVVMRPCANSHATSTSGWALRPQVDEGAEVAA